MKFIPPSKGSFLPLPASNVPSLGWKKGAEMQWKPGGVACCSAFDAPTLTRQNNVCCQVHYLAGQPWQFRCLILAEILKKGRRLNTELRSVSSSSNLKTNWTIDSFVAFEISAMENSFGHTRPSRTVGASQGPATWVRGSWRLYKGPLRSGPPLNRPIASRAWQQAKITSGQSRLLSWTWCSN